MTFKSPSRNVVQWGKSSAGSGEATDSVRGGKVNEGKSPDHSVIEFLGISLLKNVH